MQKPDIKAGTPLDIVFENEINKPNAHYLKAVVYDCHNDRIIISQTSPALNKHFLNRKVLVTFLLRIENRILRFGFAGLLSDLISDYAMSSEKTTEALLIKKLHPPEPTDFRLYFRVTPPSGTDLSLYLEEKKVSLLDISLGGAKFMYPKSHIFQPGETVKFKLLIAETVFNVDAVVRNVRVPFSSKTPGSVQHVSVEFDHNDKGMESSLGRAIMDIERSLLTKGTV